MSELKLNSPLKKEDIELRIGQTSSKGFSLLLYKTARTDVKRLDGVYGVKWKNRFFYDGKNLLCCEISIYDSDIKEWVSRVDVGTESQTEAEKGSYSDAFKRAGYKWNIGSELYQSPFIWINWEMQEDSYGNKKKFKPKGFFQSSLVVDKFDAENGQVKELVISYIGRGQIFTNKRNMANPSVQQVNPPLEKQYSANDIIELAKVKEFDIAIIENAPMFNKKLEHFSLIELNKAYGTLKGK